MGETAPGLTPAALADRNSPSLAQAIAIMARLRAPDGCPWDREQTFDSIKRHTLEETYEVFDAIERQAWPELKDELGDLLLQVLFYAQMASEAGFFDIADVATALNAKLIRRHPHIFATESGPGAGQLAEATDASAVLRNWEQSKQQEKRAAASEKQNSVKPGEDQRAASPTSALDDIPRTMPAMLEAAKLGSRASRVGFDWPDHQGLFEKLAEEMAELQAELDDSSALNSARIEEEFGDLLFTAVNLARHLKIDTESALRAANAKFRRRFAVIEAQGGGFDALANLQPAELEALWDRAKVSLNVEKPASHPTDEALFQP